MYKLVAVDLDGTLLNQYGEVTENSKRVIKNVTRKGTQVVIASGRSIDSIKNISKEIGASKYIIAGNGAVVYDTKEEKILFENYIPFDKALNIIKICEENSIFYNVYTNKTIVTSSLRYNVLYYYKENLKKEDNKKTNITIVDSIPEYIKNMQDEKIMKIFICDSTESVFNSIMKKFNEIPNVETLDVSHMSRKVIKKGTTEIPIEYYYTEISMKNVDKWNAIEFLINKLEINKEEVIAIGDNMNDKKMIEEAGLGITMEGSTPTVTEVADYITSDNNNEGVARALEKFC